MRFGYLEAGAPYLFLKELRKFCFNWLIFGRELLGGSWIILSYRIDLSGFFIDLYGFFIDLYGFFIGFVWFLIDFYGFSIDLYGFFIDLFGFFIDLFGFFSLGGNRSVFDQQARIRFGSCPRDA